MKNRRLPFGYRMEMGELTLHTQEAEVVRWIFEQYCEGVPYNSLVDKLEAQPVPYDEGKSWNKNMVARILEDCRYIGEKGCPAIVNEECEFVERTENPDGRRFFGAGKCKKAEMPEKQRYI